MSTVADKLRQARETKKLSLQQVADVLKIRADQVQALEEGNFDGFSAPVYIRGFVRTYATLLKLDVREIMAALDEELAQTEKFSEPPPLTDQKRGPLDFVTLQLSKIDWRKGVVVIGVLLLAGMVWLIASVWRGYRDRDPLQGLEPGTYQPTNTGDRLPLTSPRPRNP